MSVQVDSMEEYEVERIEGKQKIKGKKEFLIKWKEYGDTEKTWELLEHLDNARNILDKWTIQSSKVTDMDKLNKSKCDKFESDGHKSNESQGKSSVPLCHFSHYKKSSPK